MLSPQKLNQFVHLHLHTCYSLLDGACRIDELLDDAVKMGMPAMALTDHGVLYGAIEFYEKAKKRGINPIIGCEIYVAPRSRHGRTPKLDDNPHHLVVLAQNEEGYRNLLHLVSIASLEGFYYRPRVDKELLNQHSKGLIALSACLAGEVPENILKQDLQKAKEAALSYQDIFGKENYFLEVQDHDLKLQHEVNRGLVEIAKDLKIPFVATNDVHYTKRTHAGAHDVLLCIQTGKKVEDQNRLRFETEEFYLKSYAEVEPRFQEFPDSIQNTLNIAERCNLKIPLGEQFLLPQYPIPEGFSAETYLRKLCQDGMPYRYPSPGPEVTARLETELSVINSMGFADYFLIVWDFIRYAKERKIPVGPGRGSVAGSIVAFLLGITEIDPLKVLGGASILPVLFNVNESLIYLMPLVLNTYLAIPFLLGPLFTAVTTYYAVKFGWIPHFSYYIPGIYYLPSPLLGMVGTTPRFWLPHTLHGFRALGRLVIASGSWKTSVLSLVQIFILTLFYYPFYKAYEKKVVAHEEREAALKQAEKIHPHHAQNPLPSPNA